MLVAVGAVGVAGGFWIVDHPFAIGWDEADYINSSYRDAAAFERGGWHDLAGMIRDQNRVKPPANRIVVLPFTLLFGVSPILLRLVAWGQLLVTLIFVFLSGRYLAGRVAGAFAVIFLVLCPDIIVFCRWHFTESVTFLAVSATLFFLLRPWSTHKASAVNWIGLGMALGLGAWAKVSYTLVAGPALLVVFILAWRRTMGGWTVGNLLKAVVIGVLLAAPWWIFNGRSTIEYAAWSKNVLRHYAGDQGLRLWLNWWNSLAQVGIGYVLSFLAFGIVAVFAWRACRRRLRLTAVEKAGLAVCLSGTLPLIISQWMGTNHLIRLVAPVLLPLAVALGVMTARSGWLRNRWTASLAALLLACQLIQLLIPVVRRDRHHPETSQYDGYRVSEVMARMEQYDWESLRSLCLSRGIRQPSIAIMGITRLVNRPQIANAWARHGEAVRMTKLFDYWKNITVKDGTYSGQASIDWDEVMRAARQCDLAVTAPQYLGPRKRMYDNLYNAEFARRLQLDAEFSGPVVLSVGRFDPIEVWIFFRRPDGERTGGYDQGVEPFAVASRGE